METYKDSGKIEKDNPDDIWIMHGDPPSQSKKKGISFQGYFSVFLSLAILFAAILWVLYGYLPNQFYLPVSFAIIVVFGVVAYIILNKRIVIS